MSDATQPQTASLPAAKEWPPRPPKLSAAVGSAAIATPVPSAEALVDSPVWPPRPPRLPTLPQDSSVVTQSQPQQQVHNTNDSDGNGYDLADDDQAISASADERKRMRNRNKRDAKRKREAERKEHERRARAEAKRQKSHSEWTRRKRERMQVDVEREQRMQVDIERQRIDEAERQRADEERARPLLRLVHALDADTPLPPVAGDGAQSNSTLKRKLTDTGASGGAPGEARKRTRRAGSSANKREKEERRQSEARRRAEKPKVVCKFFLNGTCKRDDCTFSHDAVPIKKTELCRFFRTGLCLKGDDCLFSHDLKAVPCKFFYLYAKCQHTDAECRFSHSVSREEALAHFEKEKADKEEEERKRKEREEAEAMGIVLPATDGDVDASGNTEPAVLPFGISFVRGADEAATEMVSAEHSRDKGVQGSEDETDEGEDYDGSSDDDDEYDGQDGYDEQEEEAKEREEVLLPFGLSASSFARPTGSNGGDGSSGADAEADLSFPAYAP